MDHPNMFPRWLTKDRHAINQILLSQMRGRFPNQGVAREFERCLMGGRKIRSILFRVARGKRLANDAQHVDEEVVYAIECAHAASVLVDDILDLDRFRHGYDATQTVWGAGRSALASHILLSSAVTSLARCAELQARLIHAYEEASWGELHDIMWVPGTWVLDGYSDAVCRKTSALFSFALDAADYMNEGRLGGVLERLGVAFGRLYQYANDYYDWQPDLLLERHAADQSWPITFALPLAVHLATFGDRAIGSVRTRILSHREWLEFLRVVWHPNVVDACEEMIRSARSEVASLIQESGLREEDRIKMSNIADLAMKREFWIHELKVA